MAYCSRVRDTMRSCTWDTERRCGIRALVLVDEKVRNESEGQPYVITNLAFDKMYAELVRQETARDETDLVRMCNVCLVSISKSDYSCHVGQRRSTDCYTCFTITKRITSE